MKKIINNKFVLICLTYSYYMSKYYIKIGIKFFKLNKSFQFFD